ncbi:phytoene desaturase family protein [Actinomycetes bacterium M1A6_2h]
MATTVDAVVIGAGPNGLVAANLLADAGWDVTVLEAAQTPGGAVRTAEIAAPGFRADVCSAFYPLFAASPVMAGLRLQDYGLNMIHAPDVLAHVFADDRVALLSRDADKTAASLGSFAESDVGAWHDQIALWERVGDDILAALLRPFPPVRGAAHLLRSLGGADAIRLVRRFVQPARRFGNEVFAGEGARTLITGNAIHSGLGPDDAASAVFGWLLTMLGQTVGYPVSEGGADGIVTAMIRRLEARGGRVLCGREATDVIVESGAAVGVRDKTGETFRARKAVLADVPAPILLSRLVGEEHLPSRLVADVRNFEWDDGTIKVDWALDAPLPWTNPAAAGAGTVHLGADTDGLAVSTTQMRNGSVPTDPFLLMGQMTTSDPTRSPAGTEALWAYTHVPNGKHWGRDELERFGDVMQAAIEKHAPGFTGSVRARTIQGPGDLEGLDPSLVGGAISQGVTSIHQELFFRPVPGLGRADMPVDRLYLAGASAHPGGALHGAPGANAARAALSRNGRLGRVYRAGIGSAHKIVYRPARGPGI